jgi:hypothetical protein
MDQRSSAEHFEHSKKSLDNSGISSGSGRFVVDQMADEVSQVPAAMSHNSRSNILTAAIGKMVGPSSLPGWAWIS